MDDDALREKLFVLGGLTAGLAHEINTPLAAVRSNGDLLDQAFKRLEDALNARPQSDGKGSDDEVGSMLPFIREVLENNKVACNRLNDIVRCVRNFARIDDTDWKLTPIREIIESALTLVAHELRGRISVITEFGETAAIECHPTQLSQVFVNLLVNAAQAIDLTGEIRIKTWQDGGMVYASIADTGRGMPPDVEARMFETGFTTKEQGTGLGLCICKRTTKMHGGKITVKSEPGQGTTFLIALPVIQILEERKTNG